MDKLKETTKFITSTIKQRENRICLSPTPTMSTRMIYKTLPLMMKTWLIPHYLEGTVYLLSLLVSQRSRNNGIHPHKRRQGDP